MNTVGQVMRSAVHQAAVKRYFTADFCAAAATGVWSAHHLNPVRTRCPSCARLADRTQPSDLCACGQPLPEPPAYW